jgi:isocitrate dehydrogenase (NAD+)
LENRITDDVVVSMKVATEKACRRIARWAFHYAVQRNRRKVTVFHKANIMKLSDGLFLRCARHVHQKEYPQVAYEELIIDAACMRMVQDPTRGANIGESLAVFEAVHGSAPDIAGKGIANPLALLMSSVMMLNYLYETRSDERCHAASESIKTAYNQAIESGKTTRDLGGSLNTLQFAEAVIGHLA